MAEFDPDAKKALDAECKRKMEPKQEPRCPYCNMSGFTMNVSIKDVNTDQIRGKMVTYYCGNCCKVINVQMLQMAVPTRRPSIVSPM